MKIQFTLTFKDINEPEFTEMIVRALEPDNLDNMSTTITKDNISMEIKTEKIGSLIATVDDYLINAKIAEDIVKKTKQK
ncbi:KEOPS complex subunit Pcc1 [Methanosalsum natronophilum]|uniref:KEOPS complex subunit Pcc1 n=1 Tax=Methanosalsum natronophilum TaxID=768733 RepID=UPI0021683CB7|nr:KEOPS complex subunit Pcc1 [Methanosalsum natronophilum]MCS3923343.1 tRNA threonylcarbamoyladenosine modification (KEOPS) complex Pcc1 subunit [Methanosalsum natronophilum]